MNDSTGFGKLVPGFDFLQSLVKNAGAALPGIGQWVAPTLDPAELEKRIERAAHRPVLARAERAHAGGDDPGARGAAHDAVDAEDDERADGRPARVAEDQEPARAGSGAGTGAAPASEAARSPAPKKKAAPPTKPGQAVDPMQWWGALTNQFAQLATNAMKDTATDAAKSLAGSMLKQSFDTAAETVKQVASAPGRVAAGAVEAAVGAAGAARRRASPRRSGAAAPRPTRLTS